MALGLVDGCVGQFRQQLRKRKSVLVFETHIYELLIVRGWKDVYNEMFSGFNGDVVVK